MTVHEILKRYARGLSLTNGKVPLYESDTHDDEQMEHIHGINVNTLDFAEKQQLYNESKTLTEAYEKAVTIKKKKKERTDLEDQIRKELEEKFKKDGAGSGLPEQQSAKPE